MMSHSTFSTAPQDRPGASFENPLISSGVQQNPGAEQFYVFEPSQGIIRTIRREAQEYREIGYAVFDGYGNSLSDFDAAYVAAQRRREAAAVEAEGDNAFYHQEDEVWELIEMEQAMAEARGDEVIVYDFETKRFKRMKKEKKVEKSNKDQHNGSENPEGDVNAMTTS